MRILVDDSREDELQYQQFMHLYWKMGIRQKNDCRT